MLDVVLPGPHLDQHVFEPRYRLLVRRAMADGGGRRFGVLGREPATGRLLDVCTECAILRCEPLADGRYQLTVRGGRRCRLERTWLQDEYLVAVVAYVSATTTTATTTARGGGGGEDSGGDGGVGEDAPLDALAADLARWRESRRRRVGSARPASRRIPGLGPMPAARDAAAAAAAPRARREALRCGPPRS